MKLNIKSRTLKLGAILLPIFTLWSCADDLDSVVIDPAEGTSEYSIKLFTGFTNTRATYYDPENENEKAIKRYTLFFYESKESVNNAAYIEDVTLNNVNTNGTYNATVKIPVDVVSNLFGADNNCYVYAIINLPQEVTIDKNSKEVTYKNAVQGNYTRTVDATIENINAINVIENFGNYGTKDSNHPSITELPANFVMKGESREISLKSEDNKNYVTGTIELKRVAAKIRLWVNIPEMVYIDSNNRSLKEEELQSLYDKFVNDHPQIEDSKEMRDAFDADFVKEKNGQICIREDNANYRIFINNGTNRARIDGNPQEEEARWFTDDDYYSISRSSTTFSRVIEKDRTIINDPWTSKIDDSGKRIYEYTHDIPMYSYPNIWEQSPTEERQTYLILMVNWRIITRENFDQKDDSDVYVPCYYQVPVNSQNTSADIETGAKPNALESNRYYRIGLKVGMLGSKSFGDPQVIKDATWEVIDWKNVDIDMNLNKAAYLVFNEKMFTMNNEQRIEIPFTASDDVEVKECYVTYFKFRDQWNDETITTSGPNPTTTIVGTQEFANRKNSYKEGSEGLITSNTYGDVYYWDGYYSGSYYVGREHPMTYNKNIISRSAATELNDNETRAWNLYEKKYQNRYGQPLTEIYECYIENGKLIFNNPLIRWNERGVNDKGVPSSYSPVLNNNQTGFKDAYSKYHITIIVGLKGDVEKGLTDLRQTIHLTQYPALYIEVDNNAGTTSTTNANPNVFINNATGLGGRNAMGGAFSISGNYNPNMYIVNTTQLSEDNNILYKLGDPRSLVSDIRLGGNSTTWSYQGTHIDGTTNVRLRNYYPTEEIASGQTGSKVDFIAPIFRIASSFGKTQAINKENARKRCASYQEAGRPAGRWRVPTRAELAYIKQLSNENLIPELLATGSYYWSSTNKIQIDDNGNITEDTSNSNTYVRCVYDEWYWVNADGSQDILPTNLWTSFRWGDKQKDNPQN